MFRYDSFVQIVLHDKKYELLHARELCYRKLSAYVSSDVAAFSQF